MLHFELLKRTIMGKVWLLSGEVVIYEKNENITKRNISNFVEFS